MRRPLVAVLALVLVPMASGAKIPKACGLLTNKQVARALGSRIYLRQASKFGLSPACTWRGPPLNRYTSAGKTLRAWVMPISKARFKQSARSNFMRRVRGIGQVAYGTPFSAAVQLEVWKHGYAVTFMASAVGSPFKVEKRVAKLAVKHL